MADKDLGERNPVRDAGWLVLFLIILGIIWFAQGGATRLSTTIRPFLEPPTITSSGSSGGNNSGGVSKPSALSSLEESPYRGKVSLNISSVRETSPQKEYLVIKANYNNTESVPFSGWVIKGKSGISISIGGGAYLPYAAQVNPQNSIFLEKNGEAIVVTGQSPIGTNFRLNICTGYFNQFQNFYPSLPEECPRLAESEVPINYPDPCFNFINTLNRCRIPTSIPPTVGEDCANFIDKKANYSGCVSAHRNDADFFKTNWRVYLDRNEEIWGNEHDNIILLDQNGKLVDWVFY